MVMCEHDAFSKEEGRPEAEEGVSHFNYIDGMFYKNVFKN